MPGSTSSVESESGAVRRRVVLGAGLAATGGLLLASPARAAAASDKGEPPFLDIGDAAVRRQRRSLHLAIDNVEPCEVPAPKSIVLGTSRDEQVDLLVTNRDNRALVGSSSDGVDRGGELPLRVGKDEQATLYVFPHDFGRPGEPADHITVRRVGHEDQTLEIEVWIEPTGGQWRYLTGADEEKLDLGIVAVHAAVMRKPGTGRAEVVMFSPPRMRENGVLKENPAWSEAEQGRVERWYWDVHDLVNAESSVLELEPHPAVRATPNTPTVNIFCCGQTHQADGKLLTVGGHLDRGTDCHSANGSTLHVYDGARWSRVQPDLAGPARWYPTVTTLPDGKILITTGAKDCYFDEAFWHTVNNDYVVYDPATGKTTEPRKLANLPGWDTQGQPKPHVDVCALEEKHCDPNNREWSDYVEGLPATYPNVFVLPGGGDRTVIAVVEANRMWLYDYTPGHPEPLALQGTDPYRMNTKGTRSYPWYGSMVLLPIKPGDSKVRILAAGGQDDNDTWRLTCRLEQHSTNTAEIFEIDRDQPLARQNDGWRTLSMHRPRILCDATLLADGTVLVSGGAEEGWTNQNRCPMNDAELFDPETQQFRLAAQADTDRRYHSVALLLPDGTVLKAGSTGGFDADHTHDEGKTRPHSHFRSRTDAEVFLPPYLWRGPRPQIRHDRDADARRLRHGEQFTLTATGPSMTSDAKLALIRLGAATHGNDMDQRYVWLETRTQHHTGDSRDITAVVPTNPATTPPGDYMLVVVDHLGVPSPAQLVTVTTA